MARIRRQFTVAVPMEEIRWEDTGTVVERKSVRLFGLVIPLTLSGAPAGEYEKTSASESVTVNGVELPMTICTETYRERTGVTVSVSEAEARQRGIEAIQKQQAETLDDPAEPGSVLSEHVTVTAKNGYYTIESDCLCLENIAQEQPFYVELEERSLSSETASENN